MGLIEPSPSAANIKRCIKKIIKNVTIIYAVQAQNAQKYVCGQGFAQDLAGGAYSIPAERSNPL